MPGLGLGQKMHSTAFCDCIKDRCRVPAPRALSNTAGWSTPAATTRSFFSMTQSAHSWSPLGTTRAPGSTLPAALAKA